MPKVRTVRGISRFIDSDTAVIVRPTVSLANMRVAVLLYVGGISAAVQHIVGNVGADNGWALLRLDDVDGDARFRLLAYNVSDTPVSADLVVPLAALSGRVVCLQAQIEGQTLGIGIGSGVVVTEDLAAAYAPGTGVTSIGYDVNNDTAPVLESSMYICAVGFHDDSVSNLALSSGLAGDLAPEFIATWTIFSFTQGLQGIEGPIVPDGTVVQSIGAVAGTATFTSSDGGPFLSLVPYL